MTQTLTHIFVAGEEQDPDELSICLFSRRANSRPLTDEGELCPDCVAFANEVLRVSKIN